MKRIFSSVFAGMVGGLVGGGLLWWLVKSNEPRLEPGLASERMESHAFGDVERVEAEGSAPDRLARPMQGVTATQPPVPGGSAPGAAAPASDEAGSDRDENLEREKAREAIAAVETERAKAFPPRGNLLGAAVIPVPSEVFNALDKLGKPGWAHALHPLHGVRSPRR